ncbi:hypothetical protein DERP_003537 [Dermatophagoides pteronyssinus]|uniref:GLTSCR protein conserved domain-containing protein n=1 Tax=Dermatophagoides pteronyssinus TaxID=6956 RepID=A0ABQ8JKX7_DERPT|nr:hypothetical protein DERP_003537 [Dermatophagoides pteronyssinus]
MTNLSSSTTIPTSISSISGIIGSSNIATSIASNTLVAATPTFLNSTTGLIPITSLATTGGAGGGLQGLIFAGSHLTHSNATSNVQSIRHPSTFVSTPQFQLGPRPMTVLPQPFILPGGLQLATNGSNNQQQFVFARPSLTHQQHQTTGPQLLQIIQTSQGPQLIAQAPSAPIQTIATSNHIQTINVQQQQQQTSTVLTPTTSAAIITKNSKGSNKQILPKPNSAKNSKTNHQQNHQNQNNNSQNIKFIQTPTVGGTTNPFSTSTNQNATQFIIGGGGGVSGGIHQNHQPQLIAGPNGTFFLSNNNILHTNTGQTQFSQQPQFLLQNQQLLAIRPSGTGSLAGQTFLVNPNALTTAANNLNNNDQLTALNQLTIPQSSSIINTNKSSTTTSSSSTSTNITHHHATSLNHILLNQNTNTPIVSQASGLTAFRQQQQTPGNLIIRPQIIGQQPPTSLSSSTTTVNNNSTPQLIQIQTPNGPILLSVNLNSSQQQQQQPSQPQIQQPQTPQPQPQTIQIDNTLYSLTTNPVNQQQQPTTLNLGGGGAATLSQTILTNQTHNQQQQLLTHHHQNFSSNQQLHQQQTILSSSNNNQKNQTTTTTITKPKTQNPTKGLNLADLLKETGILTEFSPPTSPISITQTKDNNNSINNLTATTIIGQTKNTNSKQQQQQTVVNDSSGLGSSQPSPDSTTPSIDTGSCSSPSTVVTTPQSLQTTQTIKNINSIDSKSLDNNTVDDTVVSSLSSTNQSSLKTLTSSTATTTTTTCTADTSSINQSIKPSHLMNNTSLVLSQQPTLPLMTNNQTTTTTYTTILIPGTIMFLNDKRIPIATLNRTNQIGELMQRLDNQIKQNILQQQQQQPKDLQQELQQLQQTLLLIQSQPIIPSQIPQTQITTSPVITTPIIVKQEKPKSNILKAIQSQLHADQNTALHPDCRTPFRSRDDACKRLLRYHVFDQQQFSEKQLQKFDELFEQASQTLLYKRQQLYDKFRYLIIKDSMKCSPSCEQVMVNRIIIDEETAALKSDKELVASGGVLDLPPLPETWLEDSQQQLQQQDSHKNDEENIRQKHSLFDTDELMNVDYFDNITLKRKFEEDNSAADFLLESATTTTTNLFTTTSSELNSDLNALCDIFDEESIANPTSIKNDDDNDDDHFLGRSISTGGGGQSSLSWSTRSYGNVNETEAAVAVQSIIGGNDDNDIPTEDHDNDGTMDFSSLELSDNVHGDNTTATSNNHFGNEDLFPNDHQSFDDNVRESSTAIDTTNFIQNSMTNNNNNTSAADMQMNCAIKSIMMPSDSYHINNDNMSSSSTSSLNNELSYQHQNHHHHHHHQQQTSMMLPTSTISTSTNMMNRFSSSNNSMMMMNSFSVPSTMSHVNDPMLDEAVKSIL